MPELGTYPWIGGMIIGGIGFYLKFIRTRVKKVKIHLLEIIGERHGVFWKEKSRETISEKVKNMY